MKQAIIFLFAIISIVKAQTSDTTKLGVANDRGGLLKKITSAQRNGKAVDSTLIVPAGTDTMKRVTNKIFLQYGGVYGNGSDMTAKLNLLLNRPYVNDLDASYDTATIITINGTVTFPNTKGMALRIPKGTSFVGSGSINFNGAIIEADKDQEIFDTTIAVTNIRTNTRYLPVTWFRGKPDTADKFKSFDRAQNATIPGQPILVPTGSYTFKRLFSATVSFKGEKNSIVKYNPDTTPTSAYNFWTINADSVTIDNITFDGSDKCVSLISLASNVVGTKIINNHFTQTDQIAALTTTSQGILLNEANHNTFIAYNVFDSINAKNNGTARDIRGAGTIGPKNLKILYNTFGRTTNIGAGANWDCDGVTIQNYSDSLGAEIAFNYFPNFNKRALKLQCPGIYAHHNWGYSDRYLTDGNSFSFISLYGNDTRAEDNTFQRGQCASIIDVGSAIDGRTYSNIVVKDNKLYGTSGGSGNDGIRVYGITNRHIDVIHNQIENVRNGVWLDCGGRYFNILDNTVVGASGASYQTISTSNDPPYQWKYNINFSANKAIKGTSQAYVLGKIQGGSFIANSSDSTTTFLLNYAPYVDSLLNFAVSNNYTTGTGSTPNTGTTSGRLTLSNANTLRGLLYFNTDSNFYQVWQNGAWGKFGGGGGLTSTDVAGQISDSLSKGYYLIALGKSVGDSIIANLSDTSSGFKSIGVGYGMSASHTDSSISHKVDTSAISTRVNVNHVADSLKDWLLSYLNLVEGDYSATISSTTNITTSSANALSYFRVKNKVTVYGGINITPTATGNTQFFLSVPIPSNFSGISDIGGSGVFTDGEGVEIYYQSGTNVAFFRFQSTRTTSSYITFSFTYEIK